MDHSSDTERNFSFLMICLIKRNKRREKNSDKVTKT